MPTWPAIRLARTTPLRRVEKRVRVIRSTECGAGPSSACSDKEWRIVDIVGRLRERLLLQLKPLHRRMRGQKIDLFLDFAGDAQFRTRLLDVGGGPGADGEFVRLYAQFAEVVVVNLYTHVMAAPHGTLLHRIVANGCDLPFESRSFDWVFSNAVIEHVGEWKEQKRFADEIRRVAAKGYFVTTPNKFFPIEPHTLLPLYQFLTHEQQRFFVRLAPGYMREPGQISLLSSSDLRVLFPEADVRQIGLPLFPNSLVAMHRGAVIGS